MLNTSVLVLNRSFVPVHVTSVRRAFTLVYREVAFVVNSNYETFDFEGWQHVDAEPETDAIGTPRGDVRVPRVIALRHYDRIPRRHVRYSRVNVFARDKYTCQYCGKQPQRSELNLDHVIPRALGGRTSWENVVASCVDCNRRKGGRTPEQARLPLHRPPMRPRWTPFVNLVGTARYDEWRPFLSFVEPGSRSAAGAD